MQTAVQSAMQTKDYITLSIAIVGIVISSVSLYLTLRKERLRLKIKLRSGFYDGKCIHVGGDGDRRMANMVCFFVTNLSSFTLIVKEVGLTGSGESRVSFAKASTMQFDSPHTLPRTVASRTTLKLYMPISVFKNDAPKRCAYVMTDCGAFKTRRLKRQLKNGDENGAIYT